MRIIDHVQLPQSTIDNLKLTISVPFCNFIQKSMDLTTQITWLFLLAIPIACVAWTVTHEEVFREPREFCIRKSRYNTTVLGRKLFYLFTCEYCFSHYVSLFIIILTGYKLLMTDWRGYIISFFSVVWVANLYMNLVLLLRSAIKKIQLQNEDQEQKNS